MRQLYVLIFIMFIILYMMFQPSYDSVANQRGVMLEQELNRAIKLVATEGMLTTESSYGTSSIEAHIKDDLVALNFDRAKISVNSSTKTARVLRGQYVDLEIRYPIENRNLFKNFWGTDKTSYYTFRASEMSEYIP